MCARINLSSVVIFFTFFLSISSFCYLQPHIQIFLFSFSLSASSFFPFFVRSSFLLLILRATFRIIVVNLAIAVHLLFSHC